MHGLKNFFVFAANGISDGEFATMIQPMKELESLYLGLNCSRTTLTEIARLHELKQLIKTGGKIRDLRPLKGHCSLEELLCYSSDLVGRDFIPLRADRMLKKIGVPSKFRNDDLSFLRGFPHLETLDIGRSPNIDDDGFFTISKIKNIKSVKIDSNSITREGLEHFLNSRKLESLDFFWCKNLDRQDVDSFKKRYERELKITFR